MPTVEEKISKLQTHKREEEIRVAARSAKNEILTFLYKIDALKSRLKTEFLNKGLNTIGDK